MPWALEMAFDCRTYGQFPRAGDWHDQSDFEMTAMRITYRAFEVFSKQGKVEWTIPEAEFAAWVESTEEDDNG